jgi:hypothetical protein
MNVGVMKDYKLRDLCVSHTLGWSWYWNLKIKTRLTIEKFTSVKGECEMRFRFNRRPIYK